jgi:hypothetical protein
MDGIRRTQQHVPLIKIVPMATAVARGGPRTPDEKESEPCKHSDSWPTRPRIERSCVRRERNRGAALRLG